MKNALLMLASVSANSRKTVVRSALKLALTVPMPVLTFTYVHLVALKMESVE